MSNPTLDSEKMDLDKSAVNIPTGTDIVMENKEPHLPEKQSEVPEASIAAPAEKVIVEAMTEENATDKIAEAPPSPPLTSALEALIGGLDPIIVDTPLNDASVKPAVAIGSAPVEAAIEEANPSADMIMDNAQPMNIDSVQERCEEIKVKAEKTADVDEAESLLRASQPTMFSTPTEIPEGEHPEWEADSSPYESSSDDSSSDDSSSDESDEEGGGYKLLSPEEQARILMEGDGGSDDEGGKKGGSGAGAQLRTKNEIADVVVPKPDVTITPEMPISQLGWVETTVENTVLIKAQTSGEYKVLESGSVLCLENRTVIGVVAETIGRVQQPFYSVMFTNAAELAEAGMVIGTKIFYSENHSTYVFTQALKAFKGSDASNLHDEEVGAEEMEFSDDEAEAEHKRKVKQQRLERRGGKQNGGPSRGGHPLQQQHTPYDASKGLSYDDADDDGPYKPLTRPAGFAESVARSEAPQEGQYGMNGNPHAHGHFRGRGRGGDRGRGDRGRGRGDRGRGRGGNFDRRGGGYSLGPQGRSSNGHPPAQSPQNFTPAPQQPAFATSGAQFPTFPQLPYMPTPAGQGNAEYSPNQPQLPPNWVPPPPPAPVQWQQFQQAFANMQNMQNLQSQNGWPANPQAGAFVNPAFFQPPNGAPNANANPNPNPNQWNQGPRGRGRGS
ncbi:hypothetical protein HYFRA_00002367 [Hymenoscyphus fraxineus]|uniref:H/ACA ribonucleoprotein complex non-core subunit NAF1 n=1 Tax=Hymenoscyphus fraxineus TaxID=746836 RepID=A0A9N9PYX5_9HELO|nr:hypothetical protein HYFRA_00002367 [Hymenoscyphus fraxineus]